MKKSVWGLMLAASSLLAVSCHDHEDFIDAPVDNRSIVVIYDNDVHCAIEGYAKMAGYRDAVRDADTAWVATVSAGDYLQGSAVGSLSKGQYVIDVMKEMDYDAVTLGNHEFDYDVPQMRHLMGQLPAGTVTCSNFYNAAHDSLYYQEYVMKQVGSRKIAFVGVTTPGAMTSEARAFYAEDGTTLLYDLREEDCVELVQNAVNHARAAGADYVILLAHLGEEFPGNTAIYTPTLVAKTRGIDIVLDGHTHSTIPGQKFLNMDGDSVYNMQTGSLFEHIGKLVITADGKISSELVPLAEITQSSAKVAKVIDELNGQIEGQLKKEIGMNYSPDCIIEDAESQTSVRNKCMPLGTMISEAYRYVSGAQIGMVNGGGIRTYLPQGMITYGSLLDIHPYCNDLMMVSATGQQILDALESSVHLYPMHSGSFLQCAGMRYEFDANNNPELEYDPETFVLTVHGTRRITKCEVQDPVDGKYYPIDPEKKYTVVSNTYVIKDGRTVVAFRQSEVLSEGFCTVLDALINSFVNKLGGVIPEDYGK